MLSQALVLHQVAREMFERAIEESAAKFGRKDSEEVVEALRRGDCGKCDTLRFSLARQVAGFLTTLDSDIRAVYLYDPEWASGNYEVSGTEPSPSSGINLIAWTSKGESAPAALVEELCGAFRDARAKVLCEKAEGYCFSLHVTMVSDAQVREREGYAAIIGSPTARPTTVWIKYRVAPS